MIDQQLARLRTHRSNIQRYRNLLQTSLTELERRFRGPNAGRFGQHYVRYRTDDAFELR